VKESPRWLAGVGRYEEAATVMMEIAEHNGTQHNVTKDKLIDALETVHKKDEGNKISASFWQLFKGRRLRTRTLILTYA
jgi:hypothetical protein